MHTPTQKLDTFPSDSQIHALGQQLLLGLSIGLFSKTGCYLQGRTEWKGTIYKSKFLVDFHSIHYFRSRELTSLISKWLKSLSISPYNGHFLQVNLGCLLSGFYLSE